jgi:hypothetical protein
MPDDSFAEKRAVPRILLNADAKLVERAGGARMTVRISELSARGCYLDTLNPLPIGTLIDLSIRHENQDCAVPGKVIYSHAGFGMGVLFDTIPPEQQAIIDVWLEHTKQD